MTTLKQICIAPYTSMRVGGTVRLLCKPETEQELISLLSRLREQKIPYLVIGNASNLLFSDEGFDGAVILTGGIKQLSLTENGEICASCGVSLSALASFACKNGKGQLAFAYGIPGTVGGGVYMNAGAYGGQMSDCLKEAVCVDESGAVLTLSREQLQLSYRKSLLQKGGLTLLHAVFSCTDAPIEEISAQMEKNMAARKEKQPLEYPSCGSAFKRPEGHFAGALIEQAGLKGLTVGGAQVSEKHAGFIINKGNATSKDVKDLIRLVQQRVLEHSGILLEPEICIL